MEMKQQPSDNKSSEVWLSRNESGWDVTLEDGSTLDLDSASQAQLDDALSALSEVRVLRKVVGELQEIAKSVLEDDGYDRSDFEWGAYFAYRRVVGVLKG